MKKAEEVRLKKEAAELNADNIISKESSKTFQSTLTTMQVPA